MSLSIRLAKLGREKGMLSGEQYHVCRITAERRRLRRTPRQRRGEEEGAAALKGGKVQRPRQPVEDGEH